MLQLLDHGLDVLVLLLHFGLHGTGQHAAGQDGENFEPHLL